MMTFICCCHVKDVIGMYYNYVNSHMYIMCTCVPICCSVALIRIINMHETLSYLFSMSVSIG